MLCWYVHSAQCVFDSFTVCIFFQVNISPSLHSSSPLDLAVKGPLVQDLFNIVGFHLPEKISTHNQVILTLNSMWLKTSQSSPGRGGLQVRISNYSRVIEFYPCKKYLIIFNTNKIILSFILEIVQAYCLMPGWKDIVVSYIRAVPINLIWITYTHYLIFFFVLTLLTYCFFCITEGVWPEP